MRLIIVKLNSYCIFPDEELFPDELETIFINHAKRFKKPSKNTNNEKFRNEIL